MQHQAPAAAGITPTEVLVTYATWSGVAMAGLLLLAALLTLLKHRFGVVLPLEVSTFAVLFVVAAALDLTFAGMLAAFLGLAVLAVATCDYLEGRRLELLARCCRTSPPQWQAHLEQRCGCPSRLPDARGTGPVEPAARVGSPTPVPWQDLTVVLGPVGSSPVRPGEEPDVDPVVPTDTASTSTADTLSPAALRIPRTRGSGDSSSRPAGRVRVPIPPEVLSEVG